MVRRKNNVILVGGIVLAVIIVFALLFVGVQFATVGSSGLTVVSVSPASVISNDADLAQANFIVNTVANGNSQSLVGSLTPSEFASKTFNKFSSDFPLSFGVSGVKETLVYSIRNDKIPLSKFSLSSNDCAKRVLGICYSDAPACGVGSCSGSSGSCLIGSGTIKSKVTGSVWKRYCVYENQIGTVGQVRDTPDTSFSANLFVSVNGQDKVQRISSKTNPTVVFKDAQGSFLAQASWTGSLITGNAPPSGNDYGAYFLNVNTRWKLAAIQDVSTYESQLESVRNLIKSQTNVLVAQEDGLTAEGTIEKTMSGYFSNHNALVDRIMSQDLNVKCTQQGDNGCGSNFPFGSADKGTITVQTANSITYPQIIWLVKASWIGVRIPVGEPDIVSASCPAFNAQAGQDASGDVKVAIKNVGSAEGTFTVSVSDCAPFQQTSNFVSTGTVGVGSQVTVDVPMNSGVVNQEVSKNCVVRVASQDGSNSDTASVTCSLKLAQVCSPTSVRVAGNCIYKCSADGSSDELQKCCQIVNAAGNDCEKVECIKESDCSEGFSCKNNACVQTPCSGDSCPVQCTEDKQCPQGNECRANKCVKIEKEKDTCSFNIFKPLDFFSCKADEFLLPFKVAAILLLVLIVPFITLYFFKSFRLAGKQSGMVGYVVGLVIAGILSVLLWFYLLVGILIFVFYTALMGVLAKLGRK